jgi:DNA-binding CsgD family transcriptional regulator
VFIKVNDIPELFWQATLNEIKQGYLYLPLSDEFICLICGESFANGIIYPEDNLLYEAKKYIEVHIEKCHQSAFHVLLNLDKKLTGLTDHQKSILELFYEGHSDNEVAKSLNTGSTSTIRNHRFSLREKQKQAKIFLAIMELLSEQIPKKNTFIDIPRSSKQVDERFAITEQENEGILAAYFKQGPNGPLTSFPLKEKKRVAILRHILKKFAANKNYTEKEVNGILKPIYDDYVLLRRHLIEYGFMGRTQDGSSYWVTL